LVGEKTTVKVFDTEALSFHWPACAHPKETEAEESKSPRRAGRTLNKRPCNFGGYTDAVTPSIVSTILLHNVANADAENIKNYLDYVSKPGQYQLSRWLEYATEPLKLAMGHGTCGHAFRNLDAVKYILEAVLKSKSNKSQSAEACAQALSVDMLERLLFEFPSYGVRFLQKLELDVVDPGAHGPPIPEGVDMYAPVPRVLDLRPGKIIVCAASTWNPRRAWCEERKRHRNSKFCRADPEDPAIHLKRVNTKGKAKFKTEVCPHVVGVAGVAMALCIFLRQRLNSLLQVY
jgi:hypothetical protein